jgi:excisionase family DNA binding protein
MPNDMELTPRQAAVRLNVSLAYVYHLLWAEKLSARRSAQGRWRIATTAVEQRLRAKENHDGTVGG